MKSGSRYRLVITTTVAICALFVVFCLRAEAQQPNKVPRVVYLTCASPDGQGARIEALLQGLRELGYLEGKNSVV